MPDEVREHLTRDQRSFLHPESLQTLYIPSSMTVLLLFSSSHSFFLQGSGQRTPDMRSETIPSSRITPDPLYSQLHDGASSLQFTHSFFLQGSGQMTGMAIAEAWFCAQWPVFEVCVWIIVRLEDPNMAHYKISNRVSHILIFLSVGIW